MGQKTLATTATESVTHDGCDDGPTLTFPAAQHCHCHLAGIHFLSRRGQEAELARVAGYILRRYTRERSQISVLIGLDVQ